MDNSDLRKWHVALGLSLVGAILVWAYTAMEVPPPGRTMSPGMMEAELGVTLGKSNRQPVISDIRVLPADGGLYQVTFNKLVADRQNDRWLKQEWGFIAKNPMHGSTETIIQWLDRLARQNPTVTYTYEWWREPWRLWLGYSIVSGLLMLWGVVIPTTLWFAKGGYKQFREDAAAEPELQSDKAAAPVVTAADHAQLDAMLDRLEESTGGVTAGAAATPTGPAIPVANRVLDGKPLDASAAPATPEEEKDFKGEFYPVARSKHDDKPH